MVCVVVGASGVLGRAIIHQLASKFPIAVCCRKSEVARQLAATLQSQTHNHQGFSLDACDQLNVDETFKKINAEMGRPSALINVAGVSIDGLLARASTPDIHLQMQTNLLGTIFTSKSALKYMLPARQGNIINIASVVGVDFANAGQSIYAASKAGVVGFSRSLAKEVGKKGIRVNVVCPGFIESDMTAHLNHTDTIPQIPLQRFGTPAHVAHAVQYLLEAEYVTGHVLTVDGGLSL